MIGTNTTSQKTLKGTVLKMVVGFTYEADPTVTLDSLDGWYTEWYCTSKRQTIKKAEHEREVVAGGVIYYAYVDTAITGAGTLKMRLMAPIPEAGAGGERDEYNEVTTNVVIY